MPFNDIHTHTHTHLDKYIKLTIPQFKNPLTFGWIVGSKMILPMFLRSWSLCMASAICKRKLTKRVKKIVCMINFVASKYLILFLLLFIVNLTNHYIFVKQHELKIKNASQARFEFTSYILFQWQYFHFIFVTF